MTVTLEQQLSAVAREIAMRRNVYPKWVAARKMKPEKAEAELAAMEAVIATLNAERWIPVSESLPDDDLTVFAALEGSDEPVWLAYHDADGWNSVDATPVHVTHWKPMPKGPA